MDNALTAAVIHDLKNQLAMLGGHLDQASSAATGDVKASIEMARRRALYVTRTLVGFLALHKGGEQGLQAQVESADPSALLQEIQSDSWRLIEHPIEVNLALDEAPDFWFYDEYLVKLALDAALHNAARFARSNITLSAEVREAMLVFAIRDDGPGLGDARHGPESTGLGTELCRAIAAVHTNKGSAGFIQLESLPEGGTVFELCLP